MAATDKHFYSDLPAHDMSLPDLLIKEQLFHQVPLDWHVIITDIIGSTQAVQNGRHEEVNLIATGSIVTVLNIAYSMNVTVPFFFGGDGATFIVPTALLDKLMQALTLYRTHTLDNFNLELRTGAVPVTQIAAAGHEIRMAKFSSSAAFSIPIVLGNGLNYAEQLIKGENWKAIHKSQETELDLSGMQCRWDKIPPPENKEEIVTLLVIACSVEQQASVFRKVLQKIDSLYGFPDKRQPISVSRLKFKTTFSRLGNEMRLRLGKVRWFELLRSWFFSLYVYFYLRSPKGITYLKNLVEMSDTLVIDGKINTVISGTTAARKALEELLNEMETAGEILYGMHISDASIMSCYVRNLDDGHIHFVDGSEGGYTKAAKMLKGKPKS